MEVGTVRKEAVEAAIQARGVFTLRCDSIVRVLAWQRWAREMGYETLRSPDGLTLMIHVKHQQERPSA